MKKRLILSALILAGSMLLSGCGPLVFVVEPSAPRQPENEAVQAAKLPSGPDVPLSPTALTRLAVCWMERYDEPLSFSSNGDLYYGSYNGCAVILHRSSFSLDTIEELTVGNSRLVLSDCLEEIVVYFDGQLMDLSSAYDAGLLDDEQIAEIARTHQKRYWKDDWYDIHTTDLAA